MCGSTSAVGFRRPLFRAMRLSICPSHGLPRHPLRHQIPRRRLSWKLARKSCRTGGYNVGETVPRKKGLERYFEIFSMVWKINPPLSCAVLKSSFPTVFSPEGPFPKEQELADSIRASGHSSHHCAPDRSGMKSSPGRRWRARNLPVSEVPVIIHSAGIEISERI